MVHLPAPVTRAEFAACLWPNVAAAHFCFDLTMAHRWRCEGVVAYPWRCEGIVAYPWRCEGGRSPRTLIRVRGVCCNDVRHTRCATNDSAHGVWRKHCLTCVVCGVWRNTV